MSTTTQQNSEFAARPWLGFSTRNRVTMAVALYFISMSAYMDRFIIGILAKDISIEFDLSDTDFGLIAGFAFAVLYSVLGIPIARLADRGNRRHIITAALAAWSAMTVLCGMAQNYVQLFMARIGVGIGEAGMLPPTHSLVGDYFPPDGRSIAFAVLTFGNSSGMALGMVGGGYIAEEFGWRAAFIAAGLPGVLLAIILPRIIKEPRDMWGYPEQAAAVVGDGFIASIRRFLRPVLELLQAVWQLLRKPTYFHVVIATTIYFFVVGGSVLFIPLHMMRALDMPTTDVGLYFGLTTASAAAVGALIGGRLADKLSKLDPRWMLRFPAIAMVVVFPLLSLFLFLDDYRVALIFFFFAWAILTMGYNPIFSAVQAVVGTTRRATGVAFLFVSTTLIGNGLGPVFTGKLSDLLKPQYGADSLRYSMMIVLVLLLWSAWHFWRARLTIMDDFEDDRDTGAEHAQTSN
jgi:MFS family permease